jgi:hypothetical protein
MNSKTLLTSLLTLSILTPVMAMAASNCAPANDQLTTVQRTAYIKQCLAESSSPANVKRVALQQKTLGCEQNARNKALQGNEKTAYVAQCINQNDAREAAVRIRSIVVVSTR